MKPFPHIYLKIKGYKTKIKKETICSLFDGEGLTFTNEEGGLIRNENLKRNFTSLLKAADLERMRFYNMRQTLAALSLKQGMNIKTLQNDFDHFLLCLKGESIWIANINLYL
jgi:hypothetical protein